MDAQHDFLRARRHAAIARLAARLRGLPDDVGVILPYEEAIEALGFVSERPMGAQVVPLDWSSAPSTESGTSTAVSAPRLVGSAVAGSTSQAAVGRGEALPPLDLIRVGSGRSTSSATAITRVSVARALGRQDITEVVTSMGAGRRITVTDPPTKSHAPVGRVRSQHPSQSA